MKKNIIIIAILLLSYKVNIGTKEETKYYKLENRFIKSLDGVPNCFDAQAICDMQYLRKFVFNLREKGILDSKTKECLMLNGKKCCLAKLVEYEEKNDLQNNIKLKECLRLAKNAYIKKTHDIRKKISAVKGIFGQMIKESCEKRNIKQEDTLMLEWSEIKQNEEAVFHERVKTFKEFDKLLLQFYNFLGDLVFSCPKGYEQFKTKFDHHKQQKKK